MRMILSAVALVVLSSCNETSPPASSADSQMKSPQQVASFNPEWIPNAQGTGNFEICLNDSAEENGVNDITIPVGTVFESWGQMAASLRDNESQITQASRISPTAAQYAVALIEPANLTRSRPCSITKARAVTSDGFRFPYSEVPVSGHLLFAADGLYLNGKGGISNEQPGRAGEAAQMGVVVGAVVANIADAHAANEEM